MDDQLARDFAEWWSQYPHKVAKIAAEKAYRTARVKRRATAQDLLSGLAAYIAHKPDWQHYANAATWLNAGRWQDDYRTPAPAQKPAGRVPDAYKRYVPFRERNLGD
jgi:hypothetical protein